MTIEILGAISANPDVPTKSPSRTWPTAAGLTVAAWVKPGDLVCVNLLKIHGAEDFVELPWGRVDPMTGRFDATMDAEGRSFARPCLVAVQEIRQACDAEGASGVVTYRPRQCYSLGGMWVPENPHLYQPVAFKLLMAPSGPDLSPYCTRQPILVPAEKHSDWLNPNASTTALQKASSEGSFEILEVVEGLAVA